MSESAPLQIDVSELDRIIRQNQQVTLVDVREPWEVQICTIAGSVNVPLSTLPQNLDRLSAAGRLVVLCHHGGRSMQAVAWLRQNGFGNATNLSGGIDAWARQVDPAMATY
jgi:rhodanese-related sulfurtransferase